MRRLGELVIQEGQRVRLLPVTRDLSWLGFGVCPGVTRLDGSKLARMHRRVRRCEVEYAPGLIVEAALARSVRGMVVHVRHIDTLRARQHLFGPT